MRELIERLEGLAEAIFMDSQQFVEALKKKAKISDRVLYLDPLNRYTYDTVIENFYYIAKYLERFSKSDRIGACK